MIEGLLSLVVDMLLSIVGGAILKVFGLENAAELVTVIIGLVFMAIGCAVVLLGH